MKILLATKNRDKVVEIKAALAELQLDLLAASDLPHLPEIEEDAATLEGNAIKKAETLFTLTGLPCLADDTGLEVEALNGRPGVYSSRYAGPAATYADNVEKLLRELRDVPEPERGARFRTVVAFCRAEGTATVEGACPGRIARVPRGQNGFGYDPVFYLPALGKTMAELTLAEKNEISHRGRALAALKALFKELGYEKFDLL